MSEFIKWGDVLYLYVGVIVCWQYAYTEPGATFAIAMCFFIVTTNNVGQRVSSARMNLISEYITLVADNTERKK